MKNIQLSLIGILCALVIMGILYFTVGDTTEQDKELYLEEAERLLEEQIDEPFSYLHSEVVDRSNKHYRYNFKSERRGLGFSVDSFEEDGERKFVTDYVNAIVSIYAAEIHNYLEEALSSYNSKNHTVMVEANQLEDLAKALANCEKIYDAENAYHDYLFTEKYANICVGVYKTDGTKLMDYYFEGINSEDEILDWLSEMYFAEQEVPAE